MSDKPICIVSPHEKGFWQADVYLEGWREGATPDWFCTGGTGGSKDLVIGKAKNRYPNIKITDGITGCCDDCGMEHFNLEDYCDDCGGHIDQY